MREEYLVKVIIIGSASVGKSSLVHYYTHNEFSSKLMQTTGVEYSSKTVMHKDSHVKLQLWDTAGQERFKSITKTYYRGAKGALLVFDLTSRASFIQCKEWYALALEVCGNAFGCVLVGNKKDLTEERAVGFKEIKEFAETYQLLYVETSCVSGENVRNAFETMVDLIFSKIEAKLIKKEDIMRKWISKEGTLPPDPRADSKKYGRCPC